MRRLRSAGRDPAAFRQEGLRGWVVVALAALALTAILPVAWPGTMGWIQRTTPLLSLFFLFVAVGFWLNMGHRTFAVAGSLVVFLYAATAWTPAAFGIEDFAIVTLLSSFAVFALAGFNLVFLLEEMLFDLHRELHLVHRMWSFVPTLVVLALAAFLPVADAVGLLHAPSVWVASLMWSLVYVGWWTFQAINPVREGPVLKELHLLTLGTLAATGLVDLSGRYGGTTSFVPSLVMYLVLVGTWIYVSYTTLQRTHFLLQADRPAPWLAVLLSASFALLHHATFHFQVEGVRGVTTLLNQRVAYLVIGIWIGITFYVAQSLWRVLRSLRDDRRLTPDARILAGSLARLAEGFLHTEQRLEGMAARIYGGVDRILPGERERHTGSWDIGPEGLQRVEEEE